MKTEIELTLNVGTENASIDSIPAHMQRFMYFQQRTRSFDHGAMLCAFGLRRYVSLPMGISKITLCFFKRHVDDSFEIGRRIVRRRSYNSLTFTETRGYCMVDHPNTQLLQSFRHELYRYYINGYKFFRIEY